MKKLLMYMLIVCMVLTMVACGTNEDVVDETLQNGVEATEQQENDEDTDIVEVDENLLTVDITLPATFFEDETEEDIMAESEENEYKKCVINEDGSVTYTMTKRQHKEIIEHTQVSLNEMLTNLSSGEDFASIKNGEANKDFSEVTIFAEKESYEGSFDFFVLIGFQYTIDFYLAIQGVANEDRVYYIQVVDVETEEVLDSITYPKPEGEE